MSADTWRDALSRLMAYLWFLPVLLAYRLIWLVALTKHPDAEDVYMAMWGPAGLNLPRIEPLVTRIEQAMGKEKSA